MATSSIFKNFVIEGEEAVSNFIDLLFSEPKPYRFDSDDSKFRLVTDSEESKKIFEDMEKNLAKIKEEEARKNYAI